MTVRISFYEVRYQPADDDTVDWIVERVPATPNIALKGLQQGVIYLFEARSIGENGRSSDWVPVLVTVPTTNRTGALALPVNVIGNQASMWGGTTEVTYSAVSPETGSSTATISMSPGALIVGDALINYNGSSGTVTGDPGTSRTVYLYYDDPGLNGGTKPLGIANTKMESAAGNNRVAITALVISFPAAGSSGGGGGGIGGGGGGGGANIPVQTVIE